MSTSRKTEAGGCQIIAMSLAHDGQHHSGGILCTVKRNVKRNGDRMANTGFLLARLDYAAPDITPR
ncbi:hypothetical protein ANO11243_026930 [Dothideomycetidae sp. 11243]|nr:hypothetical protein ANO11243_026930 [fungal sp. No.11243]